MGSTKGSAEWPNSDGNPHVLIIGAGITGLLIAQALKLASIPYTIFESEDPTRHRKAREWGMTIHWGRPLLAELLPAELLARLHEAQVDPSFNDAYAVQFFNGKTGEFLMAMPLPGNAVRVSRRRMRKLCAEGIEIQYGKKLVSIATESKTGVTATFEDGSTYTGSVLIGSDSARSTVRKQLLGEVDGQELPLGAALFNSNVCYGDAEKALAVRKPHPINSVALHPENGFLVWISIQDVPDPEKPETWSFQVMSTWIGDEVPASGEEALAELKSKSESLAEPWKSAVQWIPDARDVSIGMCAYWVTRPWDNHGGRITLAGDAAHPMPPHRGQGLNHCITDAKNFVQAMIAIRDGADAKTEIQAYDEEIVKRGGDEVETSVKSGRLIHDYEKFTNAPVLKQGYAKAKAAA